MQTGEIILIAIGLGMDSFAVAICKGMAIRTGSFKYELKKAIIVGGYFGIFQAMMPLIGYLLGKNFSGAIINLDHWIALTLLSFIGINMIREAVKNENDEVNDKTNISSMLPLAIATSIDALAVGITFAFLKVNICSSIVIIGVVAFSLSVIGVKIGNIFKAKFHKKAEILGGIVLIAMGIKILLEHTTNLQ